MITILVVLEETEKILSYGYYHILHGYISKLLGDNNYGKLTNDYTYSNICGGRCTTEGFKFSGKPYFFIRTDKDEVWKNFLTNIAKMKQIFDGFKVLGFDIVNLDLKRKWFETDASTPILVSKKYNKVDNLSPSEIKESEQYLVNSVTKKASELGVEIDPNLSISITLQRPHRNIVYRGIINKGRNVRLKINCDEKTKEFILIHGLGRSTSCGFGFLI